MSKSIQLGVELELETETDADSYDAERELECDPLIQDVGTDGSLENGCEVRFNHPAIRGWKLDKIKNILEKLSKLGFENLYGTAGMHIHVSGPRAKQATIKAFNNLYTIQKILYPISARRRYIERPDDLEEDWEEGYYGRGYDIINDQICNFGTLEFRAFEATTNPKVFYWRLIVCRALFKHLTTDLPVMDFFKTMDKKTKNAYKSLLLHRDNPHEYGESVDEVLNWLK